MKLFFYYSCKNLLIYVLVPFWKLPAFPLTHNTSFQMPSYTLSNQTICWIIIMPTSSQNINIQMPTCGYLLSWFLIYDILHIMYLLIFIWARRLAFLIYFSTLINLLTMVYVSNTFRDLVTNFIWGSVSPLIHLDISQASFKERTLHNV